jgi:RNA polymerase sigma-70 factor (ECF subfamily)
MADRIEFQSTIWELVGRARDDKAAAVAYVADAYRAPIVAFFRRQGYDAHTAEDLSQEVFLQLCDSDVLARARREKGRFRTLMLAIAKNIARMRERRLGAEKRSPERGAASLERDGLRWDDIAAEMVDDDAFDRAWARGLLDRAMKALETECRASGSPSHAAIHAHLHRGFSYKQIADELGLTAAQVGNQIHQARERLRQFLGRLVAMYEEEAATARGEVERLEKLL